MSKTSQYVAHQPDPNGFVAWSSNEHQTWHALSQRQYPTLEDKACQEYLDGFKALGLQYDKVPQLADVDKVLLKETGWRTAAVPALINFSRFFELLANKQFPVATFIRSPEELEYLQEPDIFHEVFGHCPLLTNPAFAQFTETYGKLGLAASKEERVYLARLYWFTVEFGLLQNHSGERKIYGGGILSSPKETEFAYASDKADREPFDMMTVLRTPYRIDILQPVYFYLDSIDQLFDIAKTDIMKAVREAQKLPMLPPRFEPKSLQN
ncbi:phenylalanine 4-monooxygenase [Reinekea forsetii]|nr:phenylalanine 4-monooxygenase [Reinekea forsetii]